ncbi:MAG: hypothetical protein IT184_04875 [Acidobacteria bacterium]|nr:hypothetical protein [Acidobacteriota bacterium]
MHETGTPEESVLTARPTDALGRLSTRSLMAGLVGLVLSGLGFIAAPDVFWQSYLIAYIFLTGLTVGSLAVLMVQHLSGGAWTMISRRVLEAATRNLPLMVALFVPLAIKVPALYGWARPVDQMDEATAHAVHLKAAYLNVPFFYARALLFFLIWGALTFLLNKWSREQDEQPAVPTGPQDRRFRVLSGPGLVLYVLTVTFMSIDWVMSLDPHWYSTIFGVLTLGGQGLSTMAFTIVVLAALVRFEPMSRVADAEKIHDHSKLMFAFVLLWAYFSISQLLIIWSANLPEEIPFYLERLHGPWMGVSVAILLLQFTLPFMLLLSRSLKRNPAAVRWIAIIILVMRVVDITWTIGPVFRHEGSTLHWLDFAMVLGLGGIWLSLFWRNLAGRSLLPTRDPYFKEAVAHGGH